MNMTSYAESERICETTFANAHPWWHLYTPGITTPVLFADDDDFRFAISLLARCHNDAGSINIVAFEIMSNHIHLVANGEEEAIRRFFGVFRSRLRRYLTSKGRGEAVRQFTASIKPIIDLRTLRNTIVYVNRNGYVANPNLTPYSDPWGTGKYYFGDSPVEKPLCELNYREARRLLRCRNNLLPDSYLTVNGHVSPASFCSIGLGKALFRNAHHYFSMVGKNVEAETEIATEIGEGEFLTDPELFAQLSRRLASDYGGISIRNLTKPQKLDLARELRMKYHSSNGQIRRILGLTQYEVDSLYPLSSKKG